MKRGPLGFPRLTSVGPLVTDGGREEPKIGDAVLLQDTMEPASVSGVDRQNETVDLDIGAAGTQMATLTFEEFYEETIEV